jgi:hypothetical protein
MKYQELTIYGIFDKDDSSVYIGQTTRTLQKRFHNHHFFEKKVYPENKGKSNYNIRILKKIILFPQCSYKPEDFEGYFIQKYKDNFYTLLNKKHVPFDNPFTIEHKPQIVENKRENYPKSLNYNVNHVFTQANDFINISKNMNHVLDYLNDLHKQGKRCEWMDMYMNDTYFSNNIDVPDNWFEIMMRTSKYIPFHKYTLDGKKIYHDIKL